MKPFLAGPHILVMACQLRQVFVTGKVRKEGIMEGMDELRRSIAAREKAKAAKAELLKEALMGKPIDLIKNRKQEIEALRRATGLSVAKIKEYLDQLEKQGKIKIE